MKSTTSKTTPKKSSPTATKPKTVEPPKWPVDAPDPLPGSILPAKRIVAFYGNPLSKRMGVLGELATPDMLAKLDQEVAAWNAADPQHPVQPALHLIAVVAQGTPGVAGKYRMRMDSALIEKVYGWAKSKNAILFLDVQVGQGTLQEELPRLVPFLSRPDVHLAIDPEFSMKHNDVPGTRIGTFNAEDINYVSGLLRDLVTQLHLPPKILIVHRFTRDMLTGYKRITLDPRVQTRDQHGRLGSAGAQARIVSRVRVLVSGRVHGVQAFLPQRHEEEGEHANDAGRRLGAQPKAALHPVSVGPKGRFGLPAKSRSGFGRMHGHVQC